MAAQFHHECRQMDITAKVSTAAKLSGCQKYDINSVLDAIDQICASFEFGSQISHRAKCIYTAIKDSGIVYSGRKLDALLVGCVFHAAKEGNRPKISMKDWAKSRGGLQEKDVRSAVKFVRGHILPMRARAITLEDFVERICDALGLDAECRKTAELMADGLQKLDINVKRSLLMQAATIVWIAGLLCGKVDKNFRREVANYAPCGIERMFPTYSELYDYLPMVLPVDEFGKEVEWRNKLPPLRVRTILSLD